MSAVALCTRCVLPSNFPGVRLEQGVCNFCRETTSETLEQKRLALGAQIAQTIDRHRGAGEYDCVVAFSGGKDSSYTLMMLVEQYRLNCLAITVDNGFISTQAQENCRTVTSALGVDFITYTPAFAFMKNMYVRSAVNDSIHVKAATRRASGMCNSCINLINNYMLKTAMRHGAPLVAGGYIGGQVPRDAAVLVVDVHKQSDMRAAALKKNVAHFGPAAARHFDIGAGGTALGKVTVINPMLSIAIGEDEIIAAIRRLGWVKTQDTGLNSSNCRLNDLGIAVHYQKHGFHPYVFEVSEQVRSGAMHRDEALRKVSRIPQFAELRAQIDKLGLDVAQL